MKTLKFSTFLFVLFIFQTSYSQSARFSFVVEPGINWLSQNDDKTRSDGSIAAFNMGIMTDFFFSQRYAFSTGILFNQKGGKLIYPNNIGFKTSDGDILIPEGTSIKYNFRYLGIPIGLKFKTIELGYMTYWLNVGLNPEARIGSSAATESNILNKQNANKEASLFSLNYFLKGGVEYSLGGETALVGGVGFSSGIFDITKRSPDKVFPKTVSLVLGILF